MYVGICTSTDHCPATVYGYFMGYTTYIHTYKYFSLSLSIHTYACTYISHYPPTSNAKWGTTVCALRLSISFLNLFSLSL